MTPSTSELRDQVIRLGPWHMEVEITPEIDTTAFMDAPAGTYPESFGKVGFYRPRNAFIRRMTKLFPDGLQGRSVLDCACNCGGYLFWAKELGAGECFGFDAREHWIRQAHFLAENRSGPGGDIRFERRDLYELPELDLGRFDITLFHGIFYHLPTPVAGLKIAADLTRELVVLNTATKNGLPDGVLAVSEEGREEIMSGIYGLNWFPSGPDVLRRIFEWLGFAEGRCSQWREIVPGQPPWLGRIEMLAARSAETFRDFDVPLSRDEVVERTRFIANVAIPDDATVVVAGDEDELFEIGSRTAWRFPGDSTDGGAIGELEELRRRGARYLLVPATAFDWLERDARLRDHLETRYAAAWREHATCTLFYLDNWPPD